MFAIYFQVPTFKIRIAAFHSVGFPFLKAAGLFEYMNSFSRNQVFEAFSPKFKLSN